VGAGGDQIVTGNDFWSMGGYARYVWPCFVFACVVLAWNLWAARRYHAAARARAARALDMAAGDAS
jgi:heme exporter protein CcmD